MIDSIGSTTSIATTQRSQSTLPTNSVRNVEVLNAVQQLRQKTPGAGAPVKIFAVPQSSQSGSTSSGTKLPRGSLVDVLA